MAETRHALLVGVGHYDDPRMPALSAPTRDVEELGRVLRERGGFAVTTSLDEGFPAVREKVMDLTARRDPDGTVLLYYSGHGQRDFSGRLYLTTRRSNPADPEREGIEASFVQDRLARCRASRKIVVLDCCYSGAFDEAASGLRKDGPDGPVATLADFGGSQGAGTFVLMATEGGQTAPGEPTAEGTSRFTSLLLRGLRGDAAPNEGEITAQHLAAFAEREAPRELGIQPRSSTRQAHGRLVLVRNPDAGVMLLPKDLLEGLTSPSVLTRIGSIWRLGKLAQDSNNPPCAAAAKRVLETRLHQDDGEQDHRPRAAIQEILHPSSAAPPRYVAALAEAQSACGNAEATAAALSNELTTAKKLLSDAATKLAQAERERDLAVANSQRSIQIARDLDDALVEIQGLRGDRDTNANEFSRTMQETGVKLAALEAKLAHSDAERGRLSAENGTTRNLIRSEEDGFSSNVHENFEREKQIKNLVWAKENKRALWIMIYITTPIPLIVSTIGFLFSIDRQPVISCICALSCILTFFVIRYIAKKINDINDEISSIKKSCLAVARNA